MTALSADLPLVNKRILLAVTGSVAACKAHEIIRELKDRGATVQVLLTEAGARFFPAETAGALTTQPVLRDQFESTDPGEMAHIDAKQNTDCLLVAPATANRLLQVESPRASDTLGTVLQAYSGPVLYAPAMNPDMWDDERLRAIGKKHTDRIVPPESGTMACGETGPGRLPDPALIAEYVVRTLWPAPLTESSVVVSSGPTREPWDDIRYLTNRSSGKMGEAIAKMAGRLGADVTLVSGTDRSHYAPLFADRVTVETTREMLDELKGLLEKADAYVGAAAVSDYRPVRDRGKISSGQDDLSIPLEKNPDVITELTERFPDRTFVGFSADDAEDPEHALEKAERKDLDAIVFNSINQVDGAFGSDFNTTVFCDANGETLSIGHRSKPSTALQLWLWLRNRGILPV